MQALFDFPGFGDRQMGKLLGVFFISKRFGTFSKSHKATQLLLACFARQQAARDNRKTFFLKRDNKKDTKDID